MTHPYSEHDRPVCQQTAANTDSELQTLRQQYQALETEYLRCQTELKRMQEKSDRLEEHLYLMQDSYDLMIHSSGHRLLEKYYKLRNLLRPSVWKEALMKRIDPLLQKRRHKRNVRRHTLTREDMYLLLKQSRRMDILTDAAHEGESLQIQQFLKDAGLECTILYDAASKYDGVPYIILTQELPASLPDLYMIFCSEAALSESQYALLNGAYAIFVPDAEELSVLSKAEGLSSKLYWMPLHADDAKYHLYRFLLAVDLISFDRFYNEVGHYVQLAGERICLSLPESPERRASFEKDNHYGFEVFNGLKHHLGWIGCGLSYQFIFRKAMEQQKANLIVCEDDVYFPENFSQRFANVLHYTESRNDWSIFSGIMGDLGDVTVLDCVRENEEDFVYLNKMMSMVFNIYTPEVFALISQWDSNNRDKKTNTIDRYLEDKCHRVLTTCPFLVGHKEDLDSTIWNHKNDLYNAGIENSSKKLYLLADKFLYQKKHHQPTV